MNSIELDPLQTMTIIEIASENDYQSIADVLISEPYSLAVIGEKLREKHNYEPKSNLQTVACSLLFDELESTDLTLQKVRTELQSHSDNPNTIADMTLIQIVQRMS